MNDTSPNITVSNFTADKVLELFQVNNFFVIGIYIPVFIVAVLANLTVIWVVIKDQYMRSVTNYFLVNLSVADLLVALVCMPNAAYTAYTSIYNFGKYACKISAYLQCVAVASSIFTITAMAVDRYLAITRPLASFLRCFNKRTTVIVILNLWILSFIIFLPILLVTMTWQLPVNIIPLENGITLDNVYACSEKWQIYFGESAAEVRQALGIAWFIIMFVVPGCIMLFTYSMMSRTLCSGEPSFDSNDGLSCMQQRSRLMRSRRRVACILLLLAFVFAGCWLPYHVVNLLDDLNEESYKSLKMNLLLLGHANSALNPIIYCVLSRNFRQSIKNLICFKIRIGRRRQEMQWADSSGHGSAFGTQLRCLHRIKSVEAVQNSFNLALNRHQQSSLRSTKTCTV